MFFGLVGAWAPVLVEVAEAVPVGGAQCVTHRGVMYVLYVAGGYAPDVAEDAFICGVGEVLHVQLNVGDAGAKMFGQKPTEVLWLEDVDGHKLCEGIAGVVLQRRRGAGANVDSVCWPFGGHKICMHGRVDSAGGRRRHKKVKIQKVTTASQRYAASGLK
jgi:hypothetical protein